MATPRLGKDLLEESRPHPGSIHEDRGQPQDQAGEEGDEYEHDDVGRQERQGALEDHANPLTGYQRTDVETVANRRRARAHGQCGDKNHAKQNRRNARGHDRGQKNRREQ